MKQQFGWRTSLGVALAAGTLWTAFVGPGLAGAMTGATSSARGAGWTVTISIATTTAKAGAIIPATIALENRTGHAVRFGDCRGTYDLMNLGNAKIPNAIVVATPACIGNSIAPGTHVVHIKVWTTYEGCTRSTPGPGLPRCTASGAPVPLPAGTYKTNVVLPSIKGLPTPKALTVRLTV